MKKTPMTMKKLMKKPKAQRVSRVCVPPAAPDGFRTLAALFLEDFGIQISEGEWAEGDCREDLPVIDVAKLNSFENNLCYVNDSNPVTGIERGSVESGDNYYFVIYNPATVNGVNAAVYFEVLLTKSDAGYFFKRAGVEDSPDDSVQSEEGYRTLADIFLADFGIQLTKTEGEWTNGEWHEWLPVVDNNKINALPVTNYSQQTELFFIDDNSGAVTGVQFDSVSETGLYHFLIYNPRADIWADILLIKSTTEYSFKRTEPEYRPLNQLFLEDFGIQLAKTDGEWTNGEFWEKQNVADTALLDLWQGGLYFFCDADGNMRQPQQNSELRLRKISRFAMQEPVWLGPYVAVSYKGLDEGGFHLFLIINSMSESSAYVTLIKSEEGFFFKRMPQEGSEPEPEYLPEPEPTPEPVPEPEPVPSEPEPPAPEPVIPPTPEPVIVIPVKSALEEVYTTLTAQKLCTIVGLRTLLAKEQGISIKEAKSRITAVFKAVSDISALSGRSSLYGLGVFRQQKVKARTVVSHLGFGTYKLPRSSKFVFKPGKILKAKMAMCTGKTTAQIITTLKNMDTIKAAKSTVRKATRKKAIKKSGTSGK
jgi:nucleoid DNA-binding protein